jgi:DNA-binding GntR family transcriptional regulator
MTVADRIAAELADRILVGTLAPGTRLRQDVFAYEFGASHVPVREAFRRLEMQRLVDSTPRRGVRVTELDARGEREIAAMRAALEVLAIRNIAGRVAPHQLAAISLALEDGDKANDIFASEAANRRFHQALAAPCGLPRLLATIAELSFAYSRHVFASDQAGQWHPRTNFDHRRIFDAYAAANFEMVAGLLAAHIQTVDRAGKSKPKKEIGKSAGQ